MAPVTKEMLTLQAFLLAALVSLVLSGTLPTSSPSSSGIKGEFGVFPAAKGGVVAVQQAESDEIQALEAMQQHFGAGTRIKRRIGWGRRPGLRYSKATSVFDTDNYFNKIYNKYEKRGQSGPEAPISNFRELRMKQKVPNIQLLLPHLQMQRNNRLPPPSVVELDNPGSELGLVEIGGGSDGPNPGARITDEDADVMMYLLEEYARNGGTANRNNE